MSNSAETVTLTGTMALRDAAGLGTRLAAALSRHKTLTIDATGVAAADMAIVQLLIAARKSASTAGKPFELRIGRSGAMRDLFTKAGFAAADGNPLTPHHGLWTFTQSRSQAA